MLESLRSHINLTESLSVYCATGEVRAFGLDNAPDSPYSTNQLYLSSGASSAGDCSASSSAAGDGSASSDAAVSAGSAFAVSPSASLAISAVAASSEAASGAASSALSGSAGATDPSIDRKSTRLN